MSQIIKAMLPVVMLSAVVVALTATGQSPGYKVNIVATGGAQYVVVDPRGREVSKHSTQHAAEAVAIAGSLNDGGQTYFVRQSLELRVSATGPVSPPKPPVDPDPPTEPDDPPPVDPEPEEPEPPVDPPAPPEPGELTNGLRIVAPEEWQPRNRSHITNPNPDNHPEFTAALQSPNLWHADSMRPYADDPDGISHYYGERRLGDVPGTTNHPRTSYDPVREGTRVSFVQGEKGLPLTHQTRFKWPAISPANAKMASVQWEYRIGVNGAKGGKMFQVSGGNNRLHAEFNMYGGYGQTGDAGNWAKMPTTRVYYATEKNYGGLSDVLVRPCGSSNPALCPCQPNLPGAATFRNDNLKPEDHISLGGGQYLLGDESLSGWATITFTFDWRDPDNHLFWVHVKDERTPRTLVCGIDGGGYPLRYTDFDSQVVGLWIEFNNSKSFNDVDSEVWVRNLIVTKDQFAFDTEGAVQ